MVAVGVRVKSFRRESNNGSDPSVKGADLIYTDYEHICRRSLFFFIKKTYKNILFWNSFNLFGKVKAFYYFGLNVDSRETAIIKNMAAWGQKSAKTMASVYNITQKNQTNFPNKAVLHIQQKD